MTKTITPARVGGTIRAPASKSSMQRAVACALLAEGTSTLRAPSGSADCLAALGVARELGARVEAGPEALLMTGAPGALLAGSGALELRCGESGLCIRMFAPIAALRPGATDLIAAGSLARRPVGMAAAPLEALGARCATEGGLPPLRVEGPLRGGRAAVDASASSQFLSGLLVALPLAPEDTFLEVRGLASGGYVELTLATMRAFGVGVESAAGEGGPAYRIEGRRRYSPADFRVEGDWSGAAFLLVAGAIAGREGGAGLAVEGLDLGSAQPDRGVLEALRDSGARVEASAASVRVGPPRDPLRAFEFDARDRPDLFPPLVALAARCEGQSELRGATRLRAKESDRAEALRAEFGRLGVAVEVDGDVMRIRGTARTEGPRGAVAVDSRGDHRIAMAAAVHALAAGGAVEVAGSECVAKSWPGFFEDLESITGPAIR
jgi:3-phosphoshikimate 1-carboxyvinyltransferase